MNTQNDKQEGVIDCKHPTIKLLNVLTSLDIIYEQTQVMVTTWSVNYELKQYMYHKLL